MQLERTPQVWGITGNLGGGKTLTAVDIAVNAIKSGYFVCTNIELKMDLICRVVGDWASRLVRQIDLDHDDPMAWPCGDPRGSGGRRRVMIIIDEVAEWFDQYSATSPKVKGFLSWLRHSSKRSQDVFLVCQRREYIAKSLRILVARWVWVEDLAVFRIPKLRIRVPFMRGFVARTVWDRVGNKIQRTDFVLKSDVGRFYDTSQMLVGSLGDTYEDPRPIYSGPSPLHYFLRWGVLYTAFHFLLQA